MIKRIIFDLDNTLIDWQDEYWNKGIIHVCEKFKIQYSKKIEEKIIKVIDNYEKKQEYFDINVMQNLINKELGQNYSTDFIKVILKYFETCVPEKIDKNVIETLEYLVNKYELVVLTNWFQNQQIQRLKNAGIYKFFKNVYGTENIKMKPNREAFEVAIGELSPDECVMVGDNLEKDIDGALEIGMNAIFLNKKNITLNSKYVEIKNIEELIKIL